MEVFRKVLAVQAGEAYEELHWDGADQVMVEASMMGMKTTVEKTRAEAQRDVMSWQELIAKDEMVIVSADAGAANELMEGVDGWQPLSE